MSPDAVLLFLLILKHSFADMFLQTFNKNIDKTRYFGRGQIHYSQHSILTFFICLPFAHGFECAVLLAMFDHLAHWHIDYWKSTCVKMLKIPRLSFTFYRIQTVDQMLHFATYAAIVYLATIPLFNI